MLELQSNAWCKTSPDQSLRVTQYILDINWPELFYAKKWLYGATNTL